MSWISVTDWRTFQHYDPAKRVPPWIKNYTDLMSNEEYLALTEHRAVVLHRLWLEYARSRCRLLDDTASLSRRLGVRVTRADLVSLCDAGFISIVASKTLAEGYQVASASRAREETEERREEKEPLYPHEVGTGSRANGTNPRAQGTNPRAVAGREKTKRHSDLVAAARSAWPTWTEKQTDALHERLDELEAEHGGRFTDQEREQIIDQALAHA